MTPGATRPANRPLQVWLAAVCVSIFLMVMVGGVTRLTGSGLSIVDWQPIMGVIPPLTDGDWQASFDRYKEFPQFLQSDRTMSMTEFKFIFYWEYGHRLLGRLIGLVFILPYVIFTLSGRISRGHQAKLLVAFLLGGAQGALGWYMVRSGLIDVPRVSHYRLAAHLGLALFLLTYVFWLLLDQLSDHRESTDHPRLHSGLLMLMSLVVLQILFGAFTAGMKAGLGFNTFPMMNDQWLPDAALTLSPLVLNVTENPWFIQFVHRWLGALILASTFWLWLARGRTPRLSLLLVLVMIQFALGVCTLVLGVPLPLAVAHQTGASLVLLALTWALHGSRAVLRT